MANELKLEIVVSVCLTESYVNYASTEKDIEKPYPLPPGSSCPQGGQLFDMPEMQ
jgi:hypothetical protein